MEQHADRGDSGTPRGTIVLGHPRSGTTLLRRLLGAHPAVCAPPETHLFGACARFLASDPTADGVDMGVLAGLHFAGIPEDDVLERLRTLAFGLLDDLTAAAHKSVWVEKTAFDVFELDGIDQLCADRVRYVGIIRHPLDVAESCQEFCRAAGTYPASLHRYIRTHAQPAEAFAHSWIDATRALMRLGEQRPDQLLICRYEDLVADTADTLTDLCSFLDLDPEAALLTSAFDRDDTGALGFSDHKSYQVDTVHEASVGRRSVLPQAQQQRLGVLLNPLLEECGYEPIETGRPMTRVQYRNRYAQSLAMHAATRSETPQR